MRIDLTCPVELWHCKMPTPAEPMLTMQVYNLSDKEVSSIQVCVLCFDAEGEQFARRVERIQGLQAPSRHVFEMAIAVEEGADAQDLEVVIEKTWFDDGTIWRRGAAPAVDYTPAPLLEGERLRVMQELAGRDAASYPSDQGNVWLCVCGRPNGPKEEECRRCHRDKHEIFTKLNEASIEKIILARQNALEEAQRRQREEARRIAQEKEARQRKRRRRRKIIITSVSSVALAGALAYGIYFHAIPYYHYYMANRALEGGQYESAKEQFLALNGYLDSAALSQECDYRAALAALNGGTFTSLRTAQAGFDALGDYKDSAEKAQEARYVTAEKLLAAGSYEEAIRYYEQVPAYADARMKRKQAEYEWANELMNVDEDYAAAREKYLELGDYQSAQTMAQECLYQPAAQALAAGDPLTAIDLYRQLGAYRDSETQLKAAYYAAAEQYYNQGDYDTAASYFLLAEDYADAYRRATGCLYAPAVEAMDAGDYAQAAGMLEKIQGYLDSKALLAQCYYEQGKALMDSGDYEGAKEFFLLAPDLQAAQDALKECTYLPAMDYLQNNDEAHALALLETIPDYKDSADYVNQLRYDQAIAFLNNKQYAQAIPLLEELGNYRNSQEELANARYYAAIAMVDAGEYEDALLALGQLDGYKDSEDYMNKARYLMAADMMARGSYAEAKALLEALGDYADAPSLANECVYQMALETASEGKLTQAAEMFQSISSYQDAAIRQQECAYQAALNAREENDLAAAAKYFALAGAYKDAAAQAEACSESYYASAYAAAKRALQTQDYKGVVDALAGLAGTDYLPAKYASIPDMYKEACYQYANSLYAARKAFDALVYYKQIPGYKDVDSKRLSKTVYEIMGKWESTKGVAMEFREDGTCTIDGRTAYYYATTYALETGETPDDLAYTYNIVSNSKNSLTLRHEKTNTLYRLQRVAE